MTALSLKKPLAFFDIESTGTSTFHDRIIDLCIYRFTTDLSEPEIFNFRLNPGISIPLEASRIHGIYDKDVIDCPLFASAAERIDMAFKDADLAGFNILKFDIPLLENEFQRIDRVFDMQNRQVVDVQRIFHRKEPRDLSAALSFYCGEEHLDAHGAEADVAATARVFAAQLNRYADLPQSVGELDAFCNPRDVTWVDRSGRLKWVNGEVALNFGKKRGTALKTVALEEPGFIHWMLRSDFPRDTKEIVKNALEDRWPTPPSAND